MTRKKHIEKQARWREILDRQPGSGLSIRGFCASEKISEASFYAWRKKLRRRAGDRTQSPRTMSQREEAPSSEGLFVPLRLLDTAATLEIVHPLGYRIQLTGDVNPVSLRQVLEALDERAAR